LVKTQCRIAKAGDLSMKQQNKVLEIAKSYSGNLIEKWNDFMNVDLRISKSFHIMGVNLQIFADISNLFNYKYMTDYGFIDNNDYLAYMKSLHLPVDIGDPLGYGNIPGEDQPGDYRTSPYTPWDPNASDSQKAEWEKNKSYIDMPNQEYFAFLNPRDIFWGLKLSFDF
jgi:outer membrane receptor protein involved in Fe transport